MRPLQGRKTVASLYQGSRPSLAGYAPLGLSDSELWTLPQHTPSVDGSYSGQNNGCLGCTRAHALRWQITPRWGCRTRNFRGPPTHQLPCRWRHSIELPPCLDRLHRCTCISSLLQRFDIPFLRTVRFDLNLQAQMHAAPTGRNLPAKCVNPGTAEQAWTVPEGDALTATSDQHRVPGQPSSDGFVPG